MEVDTNEKDLPKTEDKINKIKQSSDPQTLTDLNLDNTSPFKLQLLQDFSNITSLSLRNIGLTSLKGFPKLPHLQKLDLNVNKLTSALFFLVGAPKLTHLNLSNNNIKEPVALKALGKLKHLVCVHLVNCEVTKVEQYRRRVFKFLKVLTELDGKMKTEDDALPPTVEEPKPVHNEDDSTNGRKRKSKSLDVIAKKLKSTITTKSPLMQLNELKPGLKYQIESMSGPAHSPQFVVSVEVDGNKFMGQGNSKQTAKHAAATAALKSFVQFRNTPDIMMAISNISGDYDFTTDTKNEDFGDKFVFNNKNGSSLKKMEVSGKSLKILSEADKKNPVMLLNEIHPGLTYNLQEENMLVPSQRFRMTVTVDGEDYEGTGPNKKQAKVSAARAVLSNLYQVSYNTYGSSMVSADSDHAHLFNFPQAVADTIFKQLMSTYNEIMIGNTESAKWKIIAGIAMTKGDDMKDIQIISIGTGTKCINGEHISMVGASLNDCHAEIISRRCLKDFLYTNLELHLEGEGDQSILMKREGGGYCLKPNIKFHLYISTAPCGDARIFCPHEEDLLDFTDRHPNRNSRGVLRTKIESGEGTIPIKSGQGIQTWDGILPGQERLLTMSCSDKVASWNVVGLQGALLSYFIQPIYLESIVLGGLFHPDHLSRALFGRFEKSLGDLPPMFHLNKPKMCGISSPETRHLVKSPNHSVNWTLGLGRPEVANATTGKTEKGTVSRLAKRSFFQRFLNIYGRLPTINNFDVPKPALYATYKSVVSDYQKSKKAFMKAFVDAGLGTWVKKPVEQNEFELNFKNV
ncbi:hypothetical protein JTE90_026092 [Oedothorax gibbosus]|uniref:Double-stranded RNA-specific editase 1 n=1 Tax=Oedothorax gibbosus TaxID=931172 RepID=A0AAV6UPT8_9ARAC|nr:hypothetical protein JTE90_026092 [Oedothorax gibbosus]